MSLAAVALASGARVDAGVAAASRSPVHEVDLSPTDSGLWTVPVTLDGESRPRRFIVDTGSERTVLAADVAAALDLPLRLGPILLTPGGRVDAQETTLERLDIGSLAVTDLAAVVVDLQALGRGWPLDGILGMDVLGRHDLVIDFEYGRLTLADDLRASGVALATRTIAGRRVVEARIDGQPRSLVLDTGAAAFVVFDGERAGGAAVRLGTAATATPGRVRRAEVAVGGVPLGGLPVVRVPPVAARSGSDGLLPGSVFLRIFVDADSDEVRVVPRR